MARLLLLHGSLVGPWAWSPVVDLLHEAGHDAVAPDLPFEDPSAGYEAHNVAVKQALGGRPVDRVVAHSAAGLLAPEVAMATGADVVYLAAFLADARRSVHEQWMDEPGMFCADWVELGAPPPSEDESRARRFLLHDVPATVADDAVTRLRADRSSLAARRAPHTAASATAYLVPTLDRTLSPVWMRCAARERLGVTATALPTGHLPQLARPDLLAEQLLIGVAPSSQATP